ncbi:ATPase family protein associated with various cellular activities (AAA) [Elizabethkingia sp. YR214]|uniref:AAA family ATPase n=1 Tax=Elizabethkingia sp. YR214 TaxID=2135667 RepID=UPI000D318951|nr:ATP-binding protein [Elizabethkingia sp. YR214]PUB27528.1 ATPase family protein associated with various cellular activities (AAA) [Elizabethkingia sp. YR214]
MSTTEILIDEKEKVNWEDVFLDEENRKELNQLMKEFTYIDELKKYNLPVNNKVLLHGYSGCGKTTTAKAIATSLNKPLYILDLSNFISSRIGDTAKNIRLIFDKVNRENAVLFLDEFDHIGKMRGNDDKDVGEMRRLVNSIIQMVDNFSEKALLIAATNHIDILDVALIRRFQLRISFAMPTEEELDRYYEFLLFKFPEELQAVSRRYGISFAEARDYIFTEIKSNLINELERKNQKIVS